jgi:large repetitive protein
MPLLLRASIVFACVTLIATSAVGGTITGTVTASDTRTPLRSMLVAAYDASGSLRGTATTDATGLYALVLPGGQYRVLAYDPAGAYAVTFDGGAESFETSPLRTLGGTETQTVDFTLVPAGTVTGVVLNPSGAAVPNGFIAAYNLSGTRRGFTTTNAQGMYSLVLPPGQYKLVAFDEGGAYAASFYRDARDFAVATPVGVTARATRSGIDFRLGVAARVTGNVVDASTAAPLAAIDVYAFNESGVLVSTVVTDANGVFRFALPEGRYRFVSGDPARIYGPAFYAGKRSFAAADVVALIAGQIMPGVQLALNRAGVLAGQVTAAGVPQAGIVVAAYNADGTLHASATTGSDGRWELAVAPGAFKLAAFDPALTHVTEFYAQRKSFAVADLVNAAAGTRTPNLDFSLDRAGRFTGVVTDAVTSQPLGGIIIAAYDADGLLIGQATTAADGTYAMAVPAGAHRLLAFDEQLRYATRYDGGARAFETTTPRQVAAGATSTANFTLVRGVRVTGTVTDRSGSSLSGIEVVALDMAGNHVARTVANAGAFSIVVLSDTYRFVARDPAGRYVDVAQTVVVGESQPPAIAFVLSGASKRRSAKH